jgi:lipopolysaccharide/colanic/teichoic acid biosynthesis glycosyltransferase
LTGATIVEGLTLAVPETAVSAEPDARSSRLSAISCRVLDIVVAAVLLVVLLPLLLLIAAVIRIDSRGWVVYRQERMGRGCRPFVVNKFRTMAAGAGHETHRAFVRGLITGGCAETESGVFKLTEDDRITRAGRFLRRSSLDELPQLWNVLRGDMSLVGPRPPLRYEVELYPEHWFARFAVKPGITGLWQVSGRSALTLEEMIKLDLDYARRRSLRLNVGILLRTVPAVLRARGAA